MILNLAKNLGVQVGSQVLEITKLVLKGRVLLEVFIDTVSCKNLVYLYQSNFDLLEFVDIDCENDVLSEFGTPDAFHNPNLLCKFLDLVFNV